MRRQAGKRNVLVQFQKPPSTEQDTAGQPLDEWITFATRWCKVEPLNGREYFTAQQVVADVNTRITMDYLPELDATCRAIDESNIIYNINDVIDVESRHITHVLMCGSGVVVNSGTIING